MNIRAENIKRFKSLVSKHTKLISEYDKIQDTMEFADDQEYLDNYTRLDRLDTKMHTVKRAIYHVYTEIV
jgi:hypothetical protein